jgi:nitrate/nitrite-specific signal transduction histidine kinase
VEARSRALQAQVEERTHEIEQRTRDLAALYSADEQLHRHLDLDQVLQALVDVAVDILRADKSSLMVWDEGHKKLVVRAARGFSPETVAQMTFAPGEGTVGRVAASGQAAVVEDTHADPHVARRITDPENIRSFMHVPIEIKGQIFGVFNADYAEPRAFGEDEMRLFTALAQRAALAIQNAQLYEQAQELAVVEERQRLARDLHDAVTQTLFSTSLIAEVLPRIWERDPEQGQRRLAEVRELTRGALAEMRTLLLELRPAALLEANLGDLLRQLGEAITGRARVPVAVDVQGEDIGDLPPDVKVALYRIAQEALNNVAKHAASSQATVALRRGPFGPAGGKAVELSIADDGCGFDVKDIPPDHLGVGIMRERAETIGAKLAIESQVGQGTKVTVLWTKEDRP